MYSHGDRCITLSVVQLMHARHLTIYSNVFNMFRNSCKIYFFLWPCVHVNNLLYGDEHSLPKPIGQYF